MVTNLLLEKIGQKQGRMKILKSGDPDLTMKAMKALNNPYP